MARFHNLSQELEDMMNWFFVDMALCLLFAAQHSLLTTQPAVRVIEKITRPQLWNLVFSVLTVVVMVFIYWTWQPSGISIYSLEGGWYIMVFGFHMFFIFMFFTASNTPLSGSGWGLRKLCTFLWDASCLATTR
jgi:NnrU protein.